VFRARAAEKEALDAKKLLAQLQGEAEKHQREREEERKKHDGELKALEGTVTEKASEVARLLGRVRDLEWEVRELKETQGSGGNAEKIIERAKEIKEAKRVPIPESFTSIEFVVRESKKGTIYAGEWENKQVLVIREGDLEVSAIVEVASHPFCGALVMNESVLCVGQENEFLTFLSLEDPAKPVSLGNITLQSKIHTLYAEGKFLICGQRFGFLNTVDVT
jgi:hypothetical protein